MKIIVALLAGLISCAWLPSARAADVLTKEVVHTVFSEVERKLIGEYYHPPEAATCEHGPCDETVGGHGGKAKKSKKKGLPPGLAKKDRLPPGLEKQLERNGHLPPGLEKRALPGDLEAKLPPPPPGYERAVVGTDVLLIETATGIVRDIMRDILN